ncbi:HTH-type transcriptional regulator CatM [compost metagenome]
MFLGCLERVYVRFAICGTYFVSLEIKIRLRIWIYIPVGHYGEDSDVDVKGITVFISKAMAAFVTVAQEKSLKRTAEKLCLTVPPVSRMLKNTEHWFGEKLVIIGRNSVTLTPFGINVYRQILPHYLSLQHISKRKSRAPVTISSPVVHAAFFDEIMQIVVPDIPECPVIKYAEHIHDRDRRCMPNHDRFRCHFAVLHGSYHTFSCALYSLHVTCTEPVTGTTDWLNSEQLSSHCREWTLQLLIHRLSCRLLTCFVDKSSQKTFRQLCTCGRSHFCACSCRSGIALSLATFGGREGKPVNRPVRTSVCRGSVDACLTRPMRHAVGDPTCLQRRVFHFIPGSWQRLTPCPVH